MKSPANPSIVVFSAIDGVLARAPEAELAKAARALRLLGTDAALVLCSGRTRAELQFIQQRLDIAHPFVCENGGAAVIPTGYFGLHVPNGRAITGYDAVEFGRSYDAVVTLLRRIAARLQVRIVGFGDMSIEEVARECGLSLLRARLAKLREYTEPFRILDGGAQGRDRLFKGLQAASLRATHGPGFDWVGAPVDIDVGVNLLANLYRRQAGDIQTIGLAPDMAEHQLLRMVDHAVIAPPDEEEGAIDVMDWTGAILEAVEGIRNRQATGTRKTRPETWSAVRPTET